MSAREQGIEETCQGHKEKPERVSRDRCAQRSARCAEPEAAGQALRKQVSEALGGD